MQLPHQLPEFVPRALRSVSCLEETTIGKILRLPHQVSPNPRLLALVILVRNVDRHVLTLAIVGLDIQLAEDAKLIAIVSCDCLR